MPEPRWLTEDEQTTWRLFLAATRHLFEALDRELQLEAGISHSYYVLLVALSEAPARSLRMHELARLTGSSPSRLSHAVARLEEAGWVERCRSADDRRGALATLTDLGFATVAAAAPIHVESVRRHLFDLLGPGQASQLRALSESVLGDLALAPWPAAGEDASRTVPG